MNGVCGKYQNCKKEYEYTKNTIRVLKEEKKKKHVKRGKHTQSITLYML